MALATPHGCLCTLHLFHVALDNQTKRGVEERGGGRESVSRKAGLAPGRITAAAIMKPITITRLNEGRRRAEIEKEEGWGGRRAHVGARLEARGEKDYPR